MQMAHLATFNQPPPYRAPVSFPQRLAESETCCAVNVVDQLAKGQLHEGYESLVKNYPDFSSELQVETGELESICAADVRTKNLEELGHGPDGSHTDRTSLSKKQNREVESDKADTRMLHGSKAFDMDRATDQTEQPTPELKPLPTNFRYEFLDPDKSCHVILNADLNPDRAAMLLEKLKAHISAIGCSIKDLKDMGWNFLLQVFENTVLRSDPPMDCTAGLLEDFQTQQTVIENLIEKLMGTNPATCMHKTLPADDHRHTDCADQNTGRAQPTWSMHYVPWCIKSKKPPDPYEERMVCPFDTFDTALHQKPPDPPPTNQ